MNKFELVSNKIIDLDSIINKYIQEECDGNCYSTVIEGNEYISHIYIFEKYFLRIGNYLTISILTKEDLNTKVEVIASGGGNDCGKLSAFGAELSALKRIQDYLSPYGFKKVE